MRCLDIFVCAVSGEYFESIFANCYHGKRGKEKGEERKGEMGSNRRFPHIFC